MENIKKGDSVWIFLYKKCFVNELVASLHPTKDAAENAMKLLGGFQLTEIKIKKDINWEE